MKVALPNTIHHEFSAYTCTASETRRSYTAVGSSGNRKRRRRSMIIAAGEKEAGFGSKWKEYQGVSNWAGLLDPLDDHLRREILRYGAFVDAAYKSFDSDTSGCRFPTRSLLPRCGLSGYRLTRHLAATAASGVPFLRRTSAWIGFVAVCRDPRVISRLGRRDVVVSLRGTATPLEWLQNLRASLAPLDDPRDRLAMVETGLLSLYTSGGAASLRHTLRSEFHRLLLAYGHGNDGPPLSVTITGHSLGAALATLAAYDLARVVPLLITVVSFAGPRVGNSSFRAGLERRGVKLLRIVNSDDVVPKLPGFYLPWLRAEVGEELRLCSRDSPFLAAAGNGFDFATCHDLRTYLHLVENFVSSKCPFRATARHLLRAPSTIAR